MKSSQLSRIGAISFFIGLILLAVSWHFTYPVYMPNIKEITFTQFYPSIWPGIIISLIGLLITGYYSKRKSVKAICASFFPIILYIYAFNFSYICSADSAGTKAIFEVFHYEGPNPTFVPYFQYPIKFFLDEITGQTLGIHINSIAVIFFALFGILLGLYLFLFLFKIKNISSKVALIGVPLYFTTIFSYLNYQWVPQTIALVFIFLLLVLFDKEGAHYKLLSIILFTAAVFTHAFIPLLFLLFFGFYVIKHQEFKKIFLLMVCIYISVFVYYTTLYFPIVVEAFKESVYGFGEDYAMTVTKSFREPESLMSQIISFINRIRIPIALFVITIGFLIEFIKKRVSFNVIALGITGGFYVGIGLLYDVLGLRALQILFVPLVIGIGFFITKWKKPTLAFICILLILSIAGPMRTVYDHQQYLTEEEENANNFLVYMMPTEQKKKLAISGLNMGYFHTKYDHAKLPKGYYEYVTRIKVDSPKFYQVFNSSMPNEGYVLFNPNLGRQMMLEGANREIVTTFKREILLNNKIYECGKTFIIKGS